MLAGIGLLQSEHRPRSKRMHFFGVSVCEKMSFGYCTMSKGRQEVTNAHRHAAHIGADPGIPRLNPPPPPTVLPLCRLFPPCPAFLP